MSTEKSYFYFIAMSGIIIILTTTIQTKFVLGHELHINQYFIPVFLIIFFGAYIAHLKLANYNLKEIAGTDPLTGLSNRRSFEKIISMCIDNYNRHGIKFSVLIFDIDDFKIINDTYGHQKGDKVLVNIADILKNTSRITDYCARWGGEEFIILLPNTDISGALIKAEKLREAIETSHSNPTNITCSFGVSDFYEKDVTVDGTIQRADTALYQAKFKGKNRVEYLEAA